MALVDIIALVESEAEKKSASLLEKAKKEIETLQKISEENTAQAVSLLKKTGEEERGILEKRSASQITRTDRMATATAQKQVVDLVFEKVKKELTSLSGDDLTSVFTALLSGISVEKGEIVLLGKGKSEMETALSNAKKNFSISEDLSSQKGGFVFKGEGFEMDFSFDTVVEKELRPSQEAKVFKELF